MVMGDVLSGKRFAPTPWTTESEEWLRLDQRLPLDHLARRVDQAVAMLELEPLFDSYLGVGKRALRPDLLLKLVIYEMQSKRPSPAEWARDVRECEPVRWLLFGMEPTRARLYDFRDRIAPFLEEWNAQVLQVAVEQKMTPATRAALDSSSVAAHAARRRHLLNAEQLGNRRAAIDERLSQCGGGERTTESSDKLARTESSGEATTEKVGEKTGTESSGEKAATERPAWMARSEAGLREQKYRYQRAAAVLNERQAANAQRRSDKRKPAEQIRVSVTDPDSVLARDKLNVFRPLYNVQLLRDIDTPLIFSYSVLAQNNDNGVVQAMVERMVDNVGRKPEELLVDSGYVSVHHLEWCYLAGITLYGPCQENDYSATNGKKTQQNQHTELPKSAFRWLKEEQTYQCPEGHRLHFSKTQTQQRADYRISLDLYTCPAEHCLTCPRQQTCTRTPEKGRTVSRMQNEDLVDALRERMQTEKAKRLYKLRSRTVELNFADMKEHRGVRHFHGRGLRRVTAEVGCLVLTHNLLQVEAREAGYRTQESETAQMLCAA